RIDALFIITNWFHVLREPIFAVRNFGDHKSEAESKYNTVDDESAIDDKLSPADQYFPRLLFKGGKFALQSKNNDVISLSRLTPEGFVGRRCFDFGQIWQGGDGLVVVGRKGERKGVAGVLFGHPGCRAPSW